jgi:hypothetical protein
MAKDGVTRTGPAAAGRRIPRLAQHQSRIEQRPRPRMVASARAQQAAERADLMAKPLMADGKRGAF